MGNDTDTETLISLATLTAGTLGSAYNGDKMDGYCVQARATNGLFTTGMYAFLQGSIDGTTYTHIADSTLTVAGTGTSYMWNVADSFYNYVQCGLTIPSGNVVWETKIRTKGDR